MFGCEGAFATSLPFNPPYIKNDIQIMEERKRCNGTEYMQKTQCNISVVRFHSEHLPSFLYKIYIIVKLYRFKSS